MIHVIVHNKRLLQSGISYGHRKSQIKYSNGSKFVFIMFSYGPDRGLSRIYLGLAYPSQVCPVSYPLDFWRPV